MADQRPIGGRHFERATAARGSLAGGKRPRAPLWTAAKIPSTVAKVESRGCVVASESSDLRASRRISLDHESRTYRIELDLRKQARRFGVFLRNPGYCP